MGYSGILTLRRLIGHENICTYLKTLLTHITYIGQGIKNKLKIYVKRSNENAITCSAESTVL